MMTPCTKGGHQDPSIAGIFERVTGEAVDDYSEELRQLVAAAMETAWKYFLRRVKSRLPSQ